MVESGVVQVLSDTISLRGLEVFEAVAQTGSVAKAAEQLGISLSAVSQQLKKLEEGFSVELFDHARRPLQLTPAGERFERHIEAAMTQVRRLQLELKAYELAELQSLHLGVIDDFDYRITPLVAATLANAMRDCTFLLQTRTSHELYELTASGRVDFAIAASPSRTYETIVEFPIVEDPYVLIAPRGMAFDATTWQKSLAHLPFLRIDRNLRLSETIETELRRADLNLQSRFEFDSMSTINTLVASGRGWAITTILSLLQTDQTLTMVSCHDIPFGPFSRTISGLAASHTAPTAARELADMFRNAVADEMITPVVAELPWLRDRFRLLGR